MEPQQKQLTFPSAKSFVVRTRELLKKEQQREIELFQELTSNKTIAEIEASGYGLSNMVITSSKRGYYGKTVLSLTKAYHSEKNPCLLPEDCKIQVGDDVSLLRNNSLVAEGVVSKRMGPKLQVSTRKELEDDIDLEGTPCNVVLRWNEVTFTRYFRALDDLEHSECPLLPLLFTTAVGPAVQSVKVPTNPFPKLNQEQADSVEMCLREQVFLLHGPPGTGKTTTVCVAILEAVKKGWRVLACGPSNISVDNIVQGLAGKTSCLRIGNPARIIPSVIQHCLDYQIAAHSSVWKGELKKLQAVKKRLTRGGTKEERKALRGEAKQLKQEISRLQEQVIEELLGDAQVLCCTNVGAADRVFRRYLPNRVFDLVVIDECGQALEVGCWIPLLKGKRALLAGDHKQLPPTIQGTQDSPLAYTLFSRAMEELPHIPSTMLKVQYRMNSAIMGWSNQQFYQGQLRAHSSVEEHTLRQLCEQLQPEEHQLLLVDTAGCGMGEEGARNESKFNIGEADLVLAIYKRLLKYGVEPHLIAILTPYSKQVALLKVMLTEQGLPPPDVSTVDGIQGREKQCIIISMVRSNPSREIGFLSDWRRMNVAVTRARRMLVLVGNAECVSKDVHIHALIQWVDKHGHISSAEEFRGDPTIRFGLGASDKMEHRTKEPNDSRQDKPEPKAKNKAKKKQPKQKEDGQQPLREHSEQEQQAIKNHFRAVLSQMSRELTINNATAFERKMIHEVAEELSLAHETAADKKHIKIWKKMTNDEVAQHYAELEQLKMEEEIKEMEQLEKRKQKMRKKRQRNNEKQSNNKKVQNNLGAFSELKVDDGDEEEEEKLEAGHKGDRDEEEKVEQTAQENPAPAKKKRGRTAKQAEAKEGDEQDIEQLMKQFNADRPKEDQCFKCSRKLTSVTAVCCKFCSINFCRAHVLAEEHGCDEVAQQSARKQNLTEKQLQEAVTKMKTKIKEQEEARKRKTKDSSSKK